MSPFLAFDYHQAIEAEDKPNPLPIVDLNFFDGFDFLDFTVGIATLVDEKRAGTELGAFTEFMPKRSEYFYGDRYKGKAAEYLDQSLTWVEIDASKKFCQYLHEKAQEELDKFVP